ncbi:hypothetical protein J3F84DRAFT_18553 [Trichoderma pleuroticola]
MQAAPSGEDIDVFNLSHFLLTTIGNGDRYRVKSFDAFPSATLAALYLEYSRASQSNGRRVTVSGSPRRSTHQPAASNCPSKDRHTRSTPYISSGSLAQLFFPNFFYRYDKALCTSIFIPFLFSLRTTLIFNLDPFLELLFPTAKARVAPALSFATYPYILFTVPLRRHAILHTFSLNTPSSALHQQTPSYSVGSLFELDYGLPSLAPRLLTSLAETN